MVKPTALILAESPGRGGWNHPEGQPGPGPEAAAEGSGTPEKIKPVDAAAAVAVVL